MTTLLGCFPAKPSKMTIAAGSEPRLKGPVKIDDVARRAGVSPKTVSRVVNGEAYVSARTKEVVERAIAALGYRPNLAARSLAASRSFLIGVISPYLESTFFSRLHNSAIRAAKERGLHLIVEQVDLEARDQLVHLENGLRQLRFEGVILTPPVSDHAAILDMLDRSRTRYVRISPSKQLERSDSVSADAAQGMGLLAEHLWSLGHRRIAHAVVDPRRRDLLREALIKLGADPHHLQAVPLDWRAGTVAAGRQLAESLLAQEKRPTAVFTFSDTVAAGLIGYAWAHGINIPRDLSVAGRDNDEVGQALWPALTTISQPLDEMARAAIELLTQPASERKARNVLCPVELIVRESTSEASSKRPTKAR